MVMIRRSEFFTSKRRVLLVIAAVVGTALLILAKTLKREEIYANDYVNLDHLRANIEAFIEQYYNRCRLHSALGYQTPEEFEQQLESTPTFAGATMSFFRHGEDYRPDGVEARTVK